MRKNIIWILSAGHFVTDLNQGALPALLPFFISDYGLSYTAAAGLVFAANMASSVVQPVFGYAADRLPKPWLMPVGLILAGAGLSATGFFRTYAQIMMLAVVSGIGIAAYHPESARLVNLAAGDKKNTAMSIFGIGGTAGFAAGPLLITFAVLQWGRSGTLVLCLPVLVMAAAMTARFKDFHFPGPGTEAQPARKAGPAGKRNPQGFCLLTIIIIGRSVLFYGLNTFIPVYWINHLGQSHTRGALALAVFAGSGILGNLFGGCLADRAGTKKVILGGLSALAVLMPVFLMVRAAGPALMLIIPIGMLLYASYSPSIVMGQAYLPDRIGLSSGVTLGLAVSVGGAATPFIGKVADTAGIWVAVLSVSCLPAVLFVLALFLPEPGK